MALKNVTINEPFFQGHFPGNPIMPGVLILEAMAQAGCVLTYVSRKDEIKNALIYLVAMDNVKFRRPVFPGDQLLFTVQAVRERTRSIKMSGIAEVDGKVAAQAILMAKIGEKPGEPI